MVASGSLFSKLRHQTSKNRLVFEGLLFVKIDGFNCLLQLTQCQYHQPRLQMPSCRPWRRLDAQVILTTYFIRFARVITSFSCTQSIRKLAPTLCNYANHQSKLYSEAGEVLILTYGFAKHTSSTMFHF